MKKVLFLAVAALAFAACGNSSNAEEQVEVTPTETVVETPAVATDSTAVAADSTAAVPAAEVK